MFTNLTLAALLALAPAAPAALTAHAAPSEPDDLTTSDVSFRTGDGITLGGTVFAPRGASGGLPALLLVHGSGTGGPGFRKQLRGEAEAFARQGIVVLAPDKRQDGYSPFQRDFAQLADDALAAFAVLRARPEVDPAKAGIWGLSEGGWVVPVAAAKSPDVKFAVLAAGSGVSPIRQQSWNVANKFAWSGIGGSLSRTFPTTWQRMVADAGMFGGAHHDPVPVLRNVKQPLLALWGAEDAAVPPAESAEIVRDTLSEAGNHHYTIRFIPDAPHAMHRSDPQGKRLPDLMPGYADAVGDWVDAVTSGNPPRAVVEPLPRQENRSSEVTPSAWWESAPVQFGVLGLFVLLFGAYPVLALLRRRRAGTWPARVAVVAGVVGSLGTVGYLSTLMFSLTANGIEAGPLLGDRPVVWLALQLVAVAAVVATVLLAVRWRASTDRLRHGLVLAGGVLFVPWALYWGLLLP
ncbi:hypothetical protein FHS29_003652 [Saccharothrix tamanrassetensis]|uniref:Peptidase S9 prolyl oligopeptidase catalytic domain-containing protein n=1 Tax=Saccharothrix tamanrassetensis TaxID=1051531 RepID=A0A841CID5_9PSEU|nr:prolyl oligopeptidase family serine peptidase [Saccharothrix tamanrassetensis]MBB5957059.1 hypothetical protein [Saccharothrix tamanrassetensis]